MKFFIIIMLSVLSFILIGCNRNYNNTEMQNKINTGINIEEKKSSDIEKIIGKIRLYDDINYAFRDENDVFHSKNSGEIYIGFNLNDGELFIKKSGTGGELFVSNSGSINEKVYVQSGFVFYKNFKIKTPKNILGWGVVYNDLTKSIDRIFIHPNNYDQPLAPEGMDIKIIPLLNVSNSGDVCSPYDFENFDQTYYDKLKQLGRFSVIEKNINGLYTKISYEKKYYETLFNGRVGNYCFVKNNIMYSISVALYNKKDVDNILNSFNFSE